MTNIWTIFILYETVKAVDVLICFALGFDSSEGKQKCCVSRAYAVCWVTPNFLGKRPYC